MRLKEQKTLVINPKRHAIFEGVMHAIGDESPALRNKRH